MQRLDALFAKLGEHTVKAQVPPTLATCQQAAIEAVKQREQARAAVEKAHQRQQSAAGRAEALQLMTELSQARIARKQAETKASFALLVLGRECCQSNFRPSAAEREFQEIQRLKGQLERLR